MFMQKILSMNIHSSLIYNSPKLETAQLYLRGWMVKHGIYIYIIITKVIMLSEKSQPPKLHTVWFYLHNIFEITKLKK